MAKLKKRFKAKYTQIPNLILNSESLSLKAKGLWAFINSKPNNWEFSTERIATQSKDGIDSVRAGLQELEKHGLLERNRVLGENNKFLGYDYILCDEISIKKEKAVMGFSEDGKAVDGKPEDYSNKEYSKKETVNTLSKAEAKIQEFKENPVFELNRKAKFSNLTDSEIDLTLHTALVSEPNLKFSSAINWLEIEARKASQPKVEAKAPYKPYKEREKKLIYASDYTYRSQFDAAVEKAKAEGYLVSEIYNPAYDQFEPEPNYQSEMLKI